MSQLTCDILLYAGTWSPRIGRSLQRSFARAVHGALGVEIATGGDNPPITATVTYPSGDSEYIRDGIHASLLYYLRPEYESQVEVEIVGERAALDDFDDDFDSFVSEFNPFSTLEYAP